MSWEVVLNQLIYGFSGGKKNIKFYFPATTEQNIARVNLFHKPSDSSILRACDRCHFLRSSKSLNPFKGEPQKALMSHISEGVQGFPTCPLVMMVQYLTA